MNSTLGLIISLVLIIYLFILILFFIAVILFLCAVIFLELSRLLFSIQTTSKVAPFRTNSVRIGDGTSSNEYSLIPLKIFLCHSSLDVSHITGLYKDLVQDKFAPWLAEEELVAGQDWDLEISKALEMSDIVLVLLSKASVNRVGYMQKEIVMALNIAKNQPEGRVYIIPIRLDECEIPYHLKKLRWVNLFEKTGYKRLQQALIFRCSNSV